MTYPVGYDPYYYGAPPEEEKPPEVTPRRAGRKDMTAAEYATGLAKFLYSAQVAGAFTPQQAQQIARNASGILQEKGLTPDLPYYEQVIAGQTYSEWKTQGMVGLQEAQRTRVLEARRRYEDFKRIILESPRSFEEKQGQLLNLYYDYADKAMLPETTPQDLQGELFVTLTPKEKQERRWRFAPAVPARPVAEREPRYMPAFEEMRAGLQPQAWRQWFEASYPKLLRRFKAGLPTEAEEWEAEKVEEKWSDWLKKGKPRFREEWYSRGARARGERPSAFAPRITTVRW